MRDHGAILSIVFLACKDVRLKRINRMKDEMYQLDEPAPCHKSIPDLRIDDQIEVPLSVPGRADPVTKL